MFFLLPNFPALVMYNNFGMGFAWKMKIIRNFAGK